jgi:hypothetical protein
MLMKVKAPEVTEKNVTTLTITVTLKNHLAQKFLFLISTSSVFISILFEKKSELQNI